MKHIDLWLKANSLSLNVAKTESMIISSGQKLQSLSDYRIKICNDGFQLNETTHSKFIGPTDDNLSWKAHQHDISKKPPQTLVRLSKSSHLFLCTLKLWYTKVLLNHASITVKRSEVACVTVLLTYGTIFPRMYVRRANSLDQMTLRENSLSVCWSCSHTAIM